MSIGWSQNHPAKSAIAPYALRCSPFVSTSATWDEVRPCRHPDGLVFTAAGVLDRVGELGDPPGNTARRPAS